MKPYRPHFRIMVLGYVVMAGMLVLAVAAPFAIFG